MKKLKYFSIIAMCFLCLGLSSCKPKKPHTHNYVNGQCECGEKEPHTHNFVNGVCLCGEKDPEYKPVMDIWSFYIDDQLVLEVEAPKGEEPEYPQVPENADENYRWMKMDNVVNGITYHELYLLYQVKICNIQFVNQYGEILKEEKLEWGSQATAPYYPENYSVVWDQDFSKVKDDMVIKGEINKLYSSVSFYDGDKKLDLGIDRYNIGEEITLPEYEKPGYHFVGWYLDEISLYEIKEITKEDTSDFAFYAKFIRNDFTNIVLPDATGRIISINNNGNYFSAYIGESNTNFTWTVSDDSIASVSEWGSIVTRSCGVCVLTARFKANPTISYNCLIEATSTGIKLVTPEELANKQLHKVTFKGKNGEVIDKQIVPDGYTAIHPTPYSYDGYAFNGWDKDVCNITEDTVINATYVKGTNRFEGKRLAILGDSISTYKIHMPEGYNHFYPYPAGDIRDVNHTWWKMVSNEIGTSIFVDNAWGGTTVVGGTSATESEVRLKTLLLGEEKPDIVIIFMGSNDIAGGTKATTFKASYEKMIENIKKLSPDTEIILCTLLNLDPITTFYKGNDVNAYNNVIKEIGEKNNFEVIDLFKAELSKTDLIDSVHPNKSGHEKIAEFIVEEMRKIQ